MRVRAVVVTVLAVLLAVVSGSPARAAGTPPNPWLTQRVMNMAHSGGEDEAPMNTMYAFRRAAALGADMLELDVQSTADGQLVVIHNATLDETTDGTGRVVDHTLDQIKALDAAFWFVPGRSAVHGLPDSAYPLRGARHGHPKVAGYKPKDFTVPTLREVLKAFPTTPINIEIKGTADSDTASFERTGRLLADLLDKSGRTDVIVTSFNDTALADFHARAPRVPLAPGMNGLLQYYLAGVRPIEGTVALQVPVTYQGIPVVTKEFVARAHADGYAVHVWFSGTAPDDAATYNRIIDTCADGLMPARPTLLESILDARGIERPGRPGVHPCA
ncbi:glycerophosphodiester phosphodiesterase [Luteipulveratus sp. YIM 133132]|uniref:glycerophosphodiester phosphodiesterase n=1 Tax=Luteipulveratus flavus TaxID=3031728 RepID=UPI0023B1D345|nr:glycerophosphodiester phosphodiesterase [Luteipulveratus sp. YIM 133132]MDE9367135.1 glycerophosphodiester phosphodiesterase [Luteipulveratus sp. YIM 133132]